MLSLEGFFLKLGKLPNAYRIISNIQDPRLSLFLVYTDASDGGVFLPLEAVCFHLCGVKYYDDVAALADRLELSLNDARLIDLASRGSAFDRASNIQDTRRRLIETLRSTQRYKEVS